ncbi:hypothetical protein J2X65_004344 [Ancylobacter sp. 3268]|uniref:hypothetical protein n=1 Tax=Ancylobacter sp. 3268 TaxID=2817752 RepID=UPI00285BA424|nr:hypothetical protein [Ancylobacter sp. 3268]MDR6954968.1 hypothetical protein [Ancylobacter sp. 3268]
MFGLGGLAAATLGVFADSHGIDAFISTRFIMSAPTCRPSTCSLGSCRAGATRDYGERLVLRD